MPASALLIAVVFLQVNVQAKTTRDTTGGKDGKDVSVEISLGGANNDRRGPPKRIPVTPEHLRTAFKSTLARTILERAREARLEQDSALQSYDARAYMRISAGMGFSKIGRDRLIFRHENVTRVQWNRRVGAWIDVKGARTAIPVAPEAEADSETTEELGDPDMTPLPYFPGQEPLIALNGNGMVKSSVDERDMVHPLAEGAEAYYTYEAGDSVTFHLPDGQAIQLRELRVRPRQSKWNVAVGSLWFDARTGQLVRAAYRFAVPMDVWAIVEEQDSTAQDDIPIWVKPLISPMRASISAAAVEYGLYQGRFWLPRIRSAEGDAQVSFMHVPFKFETSFRYASVNGTDSLPAIVVTNERPRPPDSLSEAQQDKWRDSVREVRRVARRAERDSIKQGLKVDTDVCARSKDSTRLVTHRSYQNTDIKVAMRVPCDIKKLATSPDLPKSIYDDGEELFGRSERDALIKEALRMGAQPPFAVGHIPPTFKWGLEFVRFNRIEGFSAGGLIEQQLGGGYTASLLGRLGSADVEPNAELTLARTNLTTTIRGRVYNRLVSARDWGNPLSFGSSLSALLFGRDEGFYYRATGAEIEWEHNRDALVTWKLFAERERTAKVENEWSLGPSFMPNITAREGGFAGGALRVVHMKGLDPNGFRMFTDLRLEGAVSDSASAPYGRGALDLTFSRGLGRIAGALTMSGGSSVGELPAQRRWYLGGAHTVRGQRPDTAVSGNAYWLSRLEIGGMASGVRPIVFGDLGWVGDRERLQDVGRPMSGVGVGASVLDGLIRADVSRGLYPLKKVRLDLYVEARF